ncbi:MAG: hypothetical protein ACFNS8_02010 [Kingella oralis]
MVSRQPKGSLKIKIPRTGSQHSRGSSPLFRLPHAHATAQRQRQPETQFDNAQASIHRQRVLPLFTKILAPISHYPFSGCP